MVSGIRGLFEFPTELPANLLPRNPGSASVPFDGRIQIPQILQILDSLLESEEFLRHLPEGGRFG
jgi:hypothetical protein